MDFTKPTQLMRAVACIKNLMNETESMLSTVTEYWVLKFLHEVETLFEQVDSGEIDELIMQANLDVAVGELAGDFSDDLRDFGVEENVLASLEADFKESMRMSFDMIKQAREIEKKNKLQVMH